MATFIPVNEFKPEPGSYKSLSQALRVSGTRIVTETSSPLGRVTVTDSTRVPLRYAPGVSLTATTEPPPQLGLFTDGDRMDAITATSDDPRRLAFVAETTSALAYYVASPQSVLVLSAGGGLEILRATHLGATHVDALELNPQVVRLLSGQFRDYTGRLVERPGIALHIGDARGYFAAHDVRYDLIQMSLAGSPGGGLGGLSEDHLHTVEALRLYVRRLSPGGFLSITRFVQLPPRDALKLLATTIEALESTGVNEPSRHVLMIRGWQTMTLLVKNGEITDEEVARAREFCDQHAFDVVWFPDMPRELANRHNLLAQPWFHDGARNLLGSQPARFIADYPFDIRPATDDRPYFENFFRWPSFWEAWRNRGRGGMALLEVGYAVLAATVLQALLAGIVLIVLPLCLLGRPREEGRGAGGDGRWRVLVYFTGIGLAFLFIEIVFLQKMLLVVHHPTVALALVLAIFLIASGAGSAWTTRVRDADARRCLIIAVSGIALLGFLHSVIFDPLLAALAGQPVAACVAVAIVLLAPLAFLMGMPFPLAIRGLEEPLVPWAWGINGCASVISPALATLLAIDIGFTAALWLALLVYALIPVAFPQSALRRAIAPRCTREEGDW